MKEKINCSSPKLLGSLPFIIEFTGVSDCTESSHIARDPSDVYVFEYVVKGTGTVVSNGKSYVASKGDVIILQKGRSHHYFSDTHDPWVKVGCHVNGSLVSALLMTYSLSDHVVIPIHDEKVCVLFYEFLALTKQPESIEAIFTACSRKFFDIILSIHTFTQSGLHERSRNAHQIKSLLDNYIHSHISLDDVSQKLFYSKSYIISVFKEEFAQTPYSYLTTRKIEEAKHLLCHSVLSIKDISQLLCFADAHYFSSQFKQHVGVSPKAYRLQNKNPES